MFFKVVMNGSCQGQDIRNILYYRSGFGVDLSQFGFAVGLQVAMAVKAHVWTGAMRRVMPNDYSLDSIDVYPINDAFKWIYQNPAHQLVGEAGQELNAHPGVSVCANIAFSLEPTAILANGIKPPKRGYIAVGPIPSAWITEGGMLTDGVYLDPDHALNVLGENLSSNVPFTLGVGTDLYPIRMKAKRGVFDNLTPYESFADINGYYTSRRVSFRRSRQPE